MKREKYGSTASWFRRAIRRSRFRPESACSPKTERGQALVAQLSVGVNTTLAVLDLIAPRRVISKERENEIVSEAQSSLRIKMASPEVKSRRFQVAISRRSCSRDGWPANQVCSFSTNRPRA